MYIFDAGSLLRRHVGNSLISAKWLLLSPKPPRWVCGTGFPAYPIKGGFPSPGLHPSCDPDACNRICLFRFTISSSLLSLSPEDSLHSLIFVFHFCPYQVHPQMCFSPNGRSVLAAEMGALCFLIHIHTQRATSHKRTDFHTPEPLVPIPVDRGRLGADWLMQGRCGFRDWLTLCRANPGAPNKMQGRHTMQVGGFPEEHLAAIWKEEEENGCRVHNQRTSTATGQLRLLPSYHPTPEAHTDHTRFGPNY